MAEALRSPTKPSKRVKRLIVFCDGTWQDSTSNDQDTYPSNVTRMSRAISRYAFDHDGDEVEQIVYYQKGVGTGISDRLFGGVLGVGISANIRAAYGFLASNYDEGDSIYIFGFSRGAYTARAIGGLVADTGLFTKRGMDQFPQLYTTYYNYRDHVNNGTIGPNGIKAAHEFIDSLGPGMVSASAAAAIRIIGVWDTVAFHHAEMLTGLRSLDTFGFRFNGERIEFADTNINERVQYAFHALSLDETRRAYLPIMWTLPKEQPPFVKLGGLADINRRPILKQVWFSGEHSDIGGGRFDHTLSDISLAWMISECVKTGLLAFDSEYILTQADAPSLLRARTISRAPTLPRNPTLDQTILNDLIPLPGSESPKPLIDSPDDDDGGNEFTRSDTAKSDTLPNDVISEFIIPKSCRPKDETEKQTVARAPWGTYYGSTNPKVRSFSDMAVDTAERLAGTGRRRPLRFATDLVWTNESFHYSIRDRVFNKDTMLELSKKGYPPNGVIYDLPGIRPTILEINISQVSASLNNQATHSLTKNGIELIDWVAYQKREAEKQNNKNRKSMLGTLRSWLPGGTVQVESEVEEPSIQGVYVPITKLGPVEKELKNRIRAADSDGYLDGEILRNMKELFKRQTGESPVIVQTEIQTPPTTTIEV